MILCQQIERLRPHLGMLSPLVTAYRNGDVAFPEQAMKWLDEAEKLLASVRAPGSSEIATLKGAIVKTEDKLRDGEEKPSRSRVRNARNAAAMDALTRAEEILRAPLAEAEDRLKRFEDKLCEGMTALALKVALPMPYAPRTAWLSAVWGLLNEEQATRPLALYLATSLSMVDRFFILDNVLCRLLEPPPAT